LVFSCIVKSGPWRVKCCFCSGSPPPTHFDTGIGTAVPSLSSRFAGRTPSFWVPASLLQEGTLFSALRCSQKQPHDCSPRLTLYFCCISFPSYENEMLHQPINVGGSPHPEALKVLPPPLRREHSQLILSTLSLSSPKFSRPKEQRMKLRPSCLKDLTSNPPTRF